jgi:hypothetical protein
VSIGRNGRVWQRMVRYVVQRDGGLCWICGHPGATSADHVIPRTEDPSRELDASNLRAAHSHPHSCPVCSEAALRRGGKPVNCNTLRQAMSVERVRRIIRERTGLPMPGDADHGARTEREGRDW